MNSAVKLIIGLLIAFIGVYWYAIQYLKPGTTILGVLPVSALATVFVGTFGAFLVFIGLIVAWIEYEDLKWEMREREETKKRRRKKR